MNHDGLFITGARGQLAKAFIDSNEKTVYKYTKDISEYEELSRNLRALIYPGHPGNAEVPKSEYVFPKIIINCAAFNDVRGAESTANSCSMLNANVLGPQNLARAARKYNCKLVHFSSNYVFDGTQAVPYTIADTPNPINRYGASKLAGEQEAAQCGGLILRIGNVYGPGVSQHNFIIKMIENLRRNKGKVVSYTIDEWISPTFTLDIVNMIDKLLTEGASGVYHLGSRDKVTRFAIANYLVDKYSLDVHVQPVLQSSFSSDVRIPKMGALDSYPLSPRDFYSSLNEYLDLFFGSPANRPKHFVIG
jgi:dTDP-4-dehydrorhamnose reductase